MAFVAANACALCGGHSGGDRCVLRVALLPSQDYPDAGRAHMSASIFVQQADASRVHSSRLPACVLGCACSWLICACITHAASTRLAGDPAGKDCVCYELCCFCHTRSPRMLDVHLCLPPLCRERMRPGCTGAAPARCMCHMHACSVSEWGSCTAVCLCAMRLVSTGMHADMRENWLLQETSSDKWTGNGAC